VSTEVEGLVLSPHVLLRQERNGGLLYDPVRNRVFRLDWEAFAIADACRTVITEEQIRQLVASCSGSVPSAEALLAQLRTADLITRAELSAGNALDPPAVGRFISRWHENECSDFSTTPGPLLVYIELTHRCNLSCVYCYNRSGPSRVDYLSGECVRSLLLEFRKFGVFYVSFTGGEPLLHPDVFELLDLAGNYGIRQILATNGTLITERIADKIASIGVNQVQVSLDAADGETHDVLRGQSGAFRRAVEGARLLSKNGVPVTICCVATEDSLPRLDALIDLSVSLGARYFRILGMMTVGRAQLLPRVAATSRTKLSAAINSLATKYSGQISVITDELRSDGDCGSGLAFCSISATGDVSPCSFATSVVVGNVEQSTFAQVWNESIALQQFRAAKLACAANGTSKKCAEAGCQASLVAAETGTVCSQ
jgi:radical SAM protein with 4Fe4S-binding SPASM domain